MQPPPSPAATPDKFAGTAPAPAEPETLRGENGRLQDKINEVLEKHPELRDATDEIALTHGMHVEVGTPFLERVRGKLQERARAIIERRPDLERLFDD
jgi:outer membrane protein TolC